MLDEFEIDERNVSTDSKVIDEGFASLLFARAPDQRALIMFLKNIVEGIHPQRSLHSMAPR